MNNTHKEQIIIAGPCAAESREQVQTTVTNAKAAGISIARMNLWKPRTRPGFEGVGEQGLPWTREAAEQGITPAMEVILPKHLELLMEEILVHVPHATLLVWIGSRNQNHIVHRELGRLIAGESRVSLMVKNQPWRDEGHWNGIIEHVLDGGATINQLLLCHRGFTPWDKSQTPMRNVPDLEMAEQLRNELGIPMIMDPSHIGGSKEFVKKLAIQFARLPWVDGQMIEVHPNPEHAKTDAKQQLTWSDLVELLPLLAPLQRQEKP